MSSQITVDCFHESGILRNGKIISFIEDDEKIHTVKNKEYTLYGEYYLGEKWTNNFRELLNDTYAEIYEIEDNKGKRYKIGDYIQSINKRQMMITKFQVDSDKEINIYGVEMVNTLAILKK